MCIRDRAYLDKYTGSMVCSKQLYKEALNHTFDEPKQWEIREINEIMNQCIDRWRYFPNPRMFSEYGRQKGWERENPATVSYTHLDVYKRQVGDTLRCKLFPADKFHKICYLFDNR